MLPGLRLEGWGLIDFLLQNPPPKKDPAMFSIVPDPLNLILAQVLTLLFFGTLFLFKDTSCLE